MDQLFSQTILENLGYMGLISVRLDYLRKCGGPQPNSYMAPLNSLNKGICKDYALGLKTVEIFEILLINQLVPDKMKKVNGMYPWWRAFPDFVPPSFVVEPEQVINFQKAQKQGFYAAMSIPFMDEKLGMHYNFFSKDIHQVQYEKERFELD